MINPDGQAATFRMLIGQFEPLTGGRVFDCSGRRLEGGARDSDKCRDREGTRLTMLAILQAVLITWNHVRTSDQVL